MILIFQGCLFSLRHSLMEIPVRFLKSQCSAMLERNPQKSATAPLGRVAEDALDDPFQSRVGG